MYYKYIAPTNTLVYRQLEETCGDPAKKNEVCAAGLCCAYVVSETSWGNWKDEVKEKVRTNKGSEVAGINRVCLD